MFNFVIVLLAPEFILESHNLILTPPAETLYNILRDVLSKMTTASDQRYLQQLFSAKELGDHKLTQLLQHLNNWQVVLHIRETRWPATNDE